MPTYPGGFPTRKEGLPNVDIQDKEEEEEVEVIPVEYLRDKRKEEEVVEKNQRWWRNGKFISLATTLLVIFIIWVVYRPTKPRFVLLDATVFALNVSATNLVTSKFQLTVRSSNPNEHIGIYYDRLLVYAFFYDQQITPPTSIPPTYQDTNGVNIWSPFVSGVSIPIAPFTAPYLKQDPMILPILFKIDGWVKWKVEPFTTKSYHIHVRCQAYIAVGNTTAGIPLSINVHKYQLYQGCTVTV